MGFKRGVWELGLGGGLYEMYDIDDDSSVLIQFSQSPQFSIAGVIQKIEIHILVVRLKPAYMDKIDAAT